MKLRELILIAVAVCSLPTWVCGQNSNPPVAKSDPEPTAQPVKEAKNAKDTKSGQQYSGMYSFLKEGEFVQLTVEDEGQVTGFISRYGDAKDGEFLDQFFQSARLEGNNLIFTTKTVQGVSFEFKGTVERGDGKNPGDDAYYVLKGTLTENSTDDNKKTRSRTQDVVFKAFSPDVVPAAAAKN
jgi:hypothetical protein